MRRRPRRTSHFRHPNHPDTKRERGERRPAKGLCNKVFTMSGAKEEQKGNNVEEKKQDEELSLEEDDLFEEFEDQVVDDIGKEKLWQGEWEDDDTHEDFAKRLKHELSK